MDYSLIVKPSKCEEWRELTFSSPDDALFQKVVDMLILFIDCVEYKAKRHYTVVDNPEFMKDFKSVSWGED